MQSKKDLIERILQSENIDIIEAILNEIEHYKLERIAKRLSDRWQDEITYEFLIELNLTEYVKTKHEYFCGGSWSPEGIFPVEYYKCKLCGFTAEKSSAYSHLKSCNIVNNLLRSCRNKEEFINEIDTFKNQTKEK